jgi:hypothetical protein
MKTEKTNSEEQTSEEAAAIFKANKELERLWSIAGRPAFSVCTPTTLYPGLTKREYFAAAALSGILASGNYSFSTAHESAVKAADRLIKELNKEDEK